MDDSSQKIKLSRPRINTTGKAALNGNYMTSSTYVYIDIDLNDDGQKSLVTFLLFCTRNVRMVTDLAHFKN